TTAVSGEAVNPTAVLLVDLIPAKRVLATRAFHLEEFERDASNTLEFDAY
ncbi:hypothetical protein A2U01_0017480, partial [Trifolium medium]|nr:hypothetical protein [Trifolium medium]